MQRALDDVSLNLRDNEFVAILGPSGSGKTTLLNIIGGLDRYDNGDLVINSKSTKEYNDRDWDTYRNHSIGFVFQSYNLIPHQNVLSNVELALTIAGVSKKERKERAIKKLTEVGLGDQLHKRPNQMSGGQMQRVALARALVNNPDILLADEPTGALDTETSIQVMDLLKEVAKDRLVVMVTHNPELAEQYASRIVKLRDGRIIDDSMPYTDEDVKKDIEAAKQIVADVQEQKPSKKSEKKKKARMTFGTSLLLSFNNLRTKKGRTILTSFAGSIGIIGIALILALSTGANQYISDIQKETMTSYPITISATSFDLNGMVNSGQDMAEDIKENREKERDPNKLYINYSDLKATTAVATSVKENNLKKFKEYLDNPKSEIQQYIGENGILYTYDVDFRVYTHDSQGKIVDTDVDTTDEYTEDNQIFGNMMEARNLMMSNMYSLMGGTGENHAQNFTEMMPGANGEIISQIEKDNYEIVYGGWPNEYNEVVLVINRRNSMLASQFYQLGLITKDEYEEAVSNINNGKDAKDVSINFKNICGKTFSLLPLCDQYKKNENGTYSSILDNEEELKAAVEKGIELKVVGIIKPTEDGSTQNLNTVVAYPHALTEHVINYCNNSEIVKDQKANPEVNVITGQEFVEEKIEDTQKANKAKDYVKNMSPADKAAFFSTLMMIDYSGGTKSLMDTQMADVSAQLSDGISKAISEAMGQVMQSITAQMQANVGKLIEKIMGSGQWIPEIPVTPEIPETPETPEESTSEESSGKIPSGFPTNGYPGLDINSIGMGPQIDDEEIEEILYDFEFDDTFDLNLDLGKTFDSIDLSMDDNDMANVVDNWIDTKATLESLISIYDQYIGVTNYKNNLKHFGAIDYGTPSSIAIYTDSFEGKDGISASIDHYNEKASEDDRIIYTDYVALLTSSLTTIVNAISYVLIAFVAISLFVSCIMIGIITNISVLERTKEIGVLRALGASKANVSQVFNAETFIIGCFSGIIGVGISLLAIIPINAIIRSLTDVENLGAVLPIPAAIILVIISIVITLIGGFIPSRKAAKQDPVIALRTE